jgi:hypothetical protein
MPLTRITTENISNTAIGIQDLNADTVNSLMSTSNSALSIATSANSNTGVVSGTYGGIAINPIIVTDSRGKITSATNGVGFLLYRLNDNIVGSNATGNQKVFDKAVTLEGSTQYEIEAQYAFSKTSGTTSHNFQIGFGGTATLNNIAYHTSFKYNTGSFTSAPTTDSLHSFIQVPTQTTILSGLTSAAAYIVISIRGTVSINEAGTFQPNYSLTTAPGGAYTVALGSYIKLTKIGSAGSDVVIGTWA